MRYIPPGSSGLCVSLVLLWLIWYVAGKQTPQDGQFTFEPRNEPNSFEPRLANYIRAVEFMLGLATGSIVLIAGSSALHSAGTIPWQFASPLVILAFCVLYGLLFMVLLIFNYEEFLHHSNYTRSRYIRNKALGFSSLTCFCLGYLWLVFAVGIALSK
jgi:hypothetical protein